MHYILLLLLLLLLLIIIIIIILRVYLGCAPTTNVYSIINKQTKKID